MKYLMHTSVVIFSEQLRFGAYTRTVQSGLEEVRKRVVPALKF